jgi:hypothetical protein
VMSVVHCGGLKDRLQEFARAIMHRGKG